VGIQRLDHIHNKITRGQLLLLSGGGLMSLAACSSGMTTLGISSNRFEQNVRGTLEFPALRPDGSRPSRRYADSFVIQPCTTGSTTCGGGPTTPPSGTPSFTYDGTGIKAVAFGSQNYGELFDGNGNLMLQSFWTANSNGSTSYKFVSPSTTVTGTQPSLASVPMNTNYSYLGSTLYVNSSSGVATMTNGSTVVTSQVTAQNAVVVTGNGKQAPSVPLTSLGSFGGTIQCNIVTVSSFILVFAATAAAIAVLGLGCAGDGPAAPFTCALAGIIANGIVAAAQQEAQSDIRQACGA
jgi:hypothetical protein